MLYFLVKEKLFGAHLQRLFKQHVSELKAYLQWNVILICSLLLKKALFLNFFQELLFTLTRDCGRAVIMIPKTSKWRNKLEQHSSCSGYRETDPIAQVLSHTLPPAMPCQLPKRRASNCSRSQSLGLWERRPFLYSNLRPASEASSLTNSM